MDRNTTRDAKAYHTWIRHQQRFQILDRSEGLHKTTEYAIPNNCALFERHQCKGICIRKTIIHDRAVGTRYCIYYLGPRVADEDR